MERKRKENNMAERKKRRRNATTTTTTTTTEEEKIPTREEVTRLKESESLFKSSLFRLQIDELISEVKVKEKMKEKMNSWLGIFAQRLMKIGKSEKDVFLDECPLISPFILDKCKKRGKKMSIRFSPPQNVAVIGSFPLGFAVSSSSSSSLSVDVVLRLSNDYFHKEDLVNLGYHVKRALYVWHLSSLLEKDELVEDVCFEYLHGDTLKPVLVVKPKGKLSDVFSVKLYPCPTIDRFQLTKLAPHRNNIRPEWFFDEKREQTSTPRYNNSILFDIFMESSFQHFSHFINNHQNVIDAILLLKVWSHQREMDEGFGCVNNFALTAFVAHLLASKKIHPLMSSYQILRNTWLQLINCKWMDKNEKDSGEKTREFFQHFPVVFLDSSENLNLLANVEPTTILRLKHEAELAVKLTDTDNDFAALFMQPVPFVRKFDHVIIIKDEPDFNPVIRNLDLSATYLDLVGNETIAVLPQIIQILRKGLGKRIDLIDFQKSKYPKWRRDENPPRICRDILIGILLNVKNGSNILDMGPSAETHEAKEFRHFWGEKSELRRFQDGSICEAVVWPSKSIADKRKACSHIAFYLMQRHFGISNSSVNYIGNQVEFALTLRFSVWPNDWPDYGTGEELMFSAVKVLDNLRQQLRDVDGLPLAITSVEGISPTFRFTEVFPSLPYIRQYGQVELKNGVYVPSDTASKVPHFVRPLDVVFSMEGSNKWPNEVEAIRGIKASFYLKLAELTKEQYELVCHPTAENISIMKDGFLFRLQIAHRREATLLKMERSDDGILRFIQNEKSSNLEKIVFHLPKLTSMLYGLQLQQSSFGCASRLAKRWLSSQLFGNHFPDIVIDLTVAYIFLSPAPNTSPKSPQIAFLRWLHLISHHDWQMAPLIVNLNEELTNEDITQIESNFSSSRNSLPAMFIATPIDKFSSSWSHDFPALPVLQRVIILARAALNTLQSQFLDNDQPADYAVIFRPSLKPYDVLIHLFALQIPFLQCSLSAQDKLLKFQLKETAWPKHLPVFDYNPVECYLQELQASYGDFAAFFYDIYGGKTIAVLWKSRDFQPEPFKVSRANCRKPQNERDSEMIINVQSVIEDFKILGEGLVESIETKTSKWNID